MLAFSGIEQGKENRGTHWTFISILMMDVVEEVSQGCTIPLPRGNKQWKIYMLEFVDDK